MPDLLIPEFDEATHTYRVKGKPEAGVTTVFRSCGIGVNSFWTDGGREFGKAVHLAIHYWAQGDLDESSLDESLKPRLDAYIKFRMEMDFTHDIAEQPLYRESPTYCGTIDQAQFGRAVIDLKCGAHGPEHALQLAAYAFMLPNPHLYERWAVHLMDTGKYSLRVFPKQELQSDFAVFQSALNTYNWRMRFNGR